MTKGASRDADVASLTTTISKDHVGIGLAVIPIHLETQNEENDQLWPYFEKMHFIEIWVFQTQTPTAATGKVQIHG